MLVSVVGCGTVGSAIASGLEARGVAVNRYDPHLKLLEPVEGITFICVYTADMNALEDIVRAYARNPLVVVKTTLMPGTTDRLIDRYGNHVIYSPEFLSERTALSDFMNPDKVVLGTRNVDLAWRMLEDLFGPDDAVLTIKPVEAEILKLAINAFYSIKVSHFNEVADLCRKHGADYEAVRFGCKLDRYIADQHMSVDKDGYRGFGGKCLPKDARMFEQACGLAGVPAHVVSAALEDNRSRGIQC